MLATEEIKVEDNTFKKWKRIKLGEIIKVKSGEGLTALQMKDGGVHPVYGGNGINGYYDKYIVTEPTLIIGRVGAKCGVIHITKPKSWITDNALMVTFDKKQVDIKFLYWTLTVANLNKLSVSTAQPVVSGAKIYAVDILLPPLPEQHRIVEKIEELFSELDYAITTLKTTQRLLQTYRQSILKFSINENENLQPIESIIEKLDQGWSPKCENESSFSKDEWAVIKTTAVQAGRFLEEENKILPTNLKPRLQHELKVEDILITRAGPRVRVGICCLIRNVRPKLINCDKVYRIRVNQKKIKPDYFELVMNSPKILDKIGEMKTGISDSGVNLTQKGFLQITIPVPPIIEQTKIVSEIETRLSESDYLLETITQQLIHAESLRQSILQRAFSGEL